MLILFVELNRLEYLPGVCRISSYTYVTNGAFGDPIGLLGVDCGSSGSTGMFHSVILNVYLESFVYLELYLESLLPFFE